MSGALQADLFGGEMLREAGIALVTSHNLDWKSQTKARFGVWISSKPSGFRFTSSDFRIYASEIGLPRPAHDNMWGALFPSLCREFAIEPTGEMRKATIKASHARLVRVYRKL